MSFANYQPISLGAVADAVYGGSWTAYDFALLFFEEYGDDVLDVKSNLVDAFDYAGISYVEASLDAWITSVSGLSASAQASSFLATYGTELDQLIALSPVEGSGWVPVGANTTFRSFFQTLVAGSGYSGGVLQAAGLSIPVSSIEFFGHIGSNIDQISLYGFSSLSLGQGISLPAGGLFLTSGGGLYPDQNTESSYSVSRGQDGSAELTAFAQSAYSGAGSSQDASILKFDFTPGVNTKTLLVDVVFASDEYPEWTNTNFVDIAAIWYDSQSSVNYAIFGDEGDKPLSIIPTSTQDVRFVDNDPWDDNHNSNGAVPSPGNAGLAAEFDGITKTLTIAVPVFGIPLNADGTLTINFGVADTGDTIYDSGFWLSNLRTSNYEIAGTLLAQTVTPGAFYLAPPTTPVYAQVGAGAQVTGSDEPDVFEFEADEDAAFEVNATPQQLDGDAYFNVNNNTEFNIAGTYAPGAFQIVEGSAIITIDVNGNGFDSSDPTFTLEGDYFDVSQFQISSTGGVTTLTYTGPVDYGAALSNAGASASSTPSSASASSSESSPVEIVGDDGDNIISGGEGADVLRGAGGNDQLRGGAGPDALYGGTGDDLLIGGRGRDVLRGGSGSDRLTGGKGRDRLKGGRGADVMNGGAGVDTYVFSSVQDSLVGAPDTVFYDGTDLFDFSSFDADPSLEGRQGISFVETGEFTGAIGQLRVLGSMIELDLNGDLVADFAINVIGDSPLTAASLLL